MSHIQPAQPSPNPLVQQAVNSSLRSKLAKRKDTGRKPEQILAFSGIATGDRVGEICGGSGYFTTMLACLVGPEGHIYVHNTPGSVKRRNGNPTEKLIQKTKLQNIASLVSPMDEITFPRDLDFIFSSNTYHDAVWTGVDRTRMNAKLFECLKPDGNFLLTDHHAAPGAGASVAKLYHRIERQTVIEEICAAGFRLVGESDALYFSDDPLDVDVHDQQVRLKTNRFVLKFQK